MIRGLRTVIYHVTDLAQAKAWYNRVLEKEPYFDQPFYVGYSVGGFELGLVPDGTPGAGGVLARITNLKSEISKRNAENRVG